ncbi:uncharacterized protein ATNIH1004_010808 [Aspergillus tanneri]|uniref:Uncharacterized protein n=1 Tax=Aspergillus tanneri TaxID=1220188 RepID=A0A5M9MBH4_9EURO|nr:uncharacterized protein ATNIH1004_010808 [Aspergillus tanneri]KAA8641869.1 hypothetical protein ATNIH1004_010808 [Aspergillus tanneri]
MNICRFSAIQGSGEPLCISASNSGNLDDDAFGIRHFVDDLGLEVGVCLFFAKNMGLYGTIHSNVFRLLADKNKNNGSQTRRMSWMRLSHHVYQQYGVKYTLCSENAAAVRAIRSTGLQGENRIDDSE